MSKSIIKQLRFQKRGCFWNYKERRVYFYIRKVHDLSNTSRVNSLKEDVDFVYDIYLH